ncbi:MAG: hypothetical protein ACFFDN_48860 [Candidatus Hodarchaeota archaeon]
MKKITMYECLNDFEFKETPKEISYIEGKPLILSNEFSFFHNKNKFRKELNRLQYIFKDYTKNSLIAAGIRDTYLKEEYTEKYLIVLFTTNEFVKNANQIIEKYINKKFKSGCFYLETTSKYMLLIAKEMKGLISGIDIMEEIFTQTFEDYLKQEKFDDYIKIRQFFLNNC